MASAVAPPDSLRSAWKLPALFSLTAFLGASLIFIVQPLVSKLLLPAYGGSAAVWTTSSFFFQVVLLLGYILVHVSVRAGRARQPMVLAALGVIALAFLPLALPGDAVPGGDSSPTGWLIRTLVIMIAAPFLVLSTTGPVLQKWYSWTGAPRAEDPYFLYAASNVGSFIGLFSYPFLVEPFMTLGAQKIAWSAGFALFLALLAVCALQLRKSGPETIVTMIEGSSETLTLVRQLKWVGLAFLPSALMLAVTTHIATDVASVPLLWVIPLAIYIATMVLAFASTARTTPLPILAIAFLASIAAMGLALAPLLLSSIQTSIVLFVALFFIAYAGHSLLANDRPSPKHLTRYFVLVSLGGALGGLFNSVLAPLVFNRPVEFPLLLTLVAFLLASVPRLKKWSIVVFTILLAVVSLSELNPDDDVLERSRTFYGSYKVLDRGEYFTFVHGTTVHGVQSKSEPERPISYYVSEGPVGDVFDGRTFDQSTVVGLGIGQLAAYSAPNTKMDFIDIDPEVVRIAKDSGYFTYLADAEGEVTTEAQDGRLAVEELPLKSQDLILLDAFSSDSIPIHLLTEEAIELYASRVKEDGLIVVHISNRVFDLRPPLMAAAEELGLTPMFRGARPEEVGEVGLPSEWVAFPMGDEEEERLRDLGWIDLSEDPASPKPIKWTDDYSSVLSVLW